MMLHTKYQSSSPCGFSEDFHLENQFLACVTLICNRLEQGHIRIIPTKFGQNPASSNRRRCPLKQLLTMDI